MTCGVAGRVLEDGANSGRRRNATSKRSEGAIWEGGGGMGVAADTAMATLWMLAWSANGGMQKYLILKYQRDQRSS